MRRFWPQTFLKSSLLVAIASIGMAHAYAENPNAENPKPVKTLGLQSQSLQSPSPSQSQSQAEIALANLIAQAKQKKLATHPSWLRLHYYEKSNDSKNSNQKNSTQKNSNQNQADEPLQAYKSKVDNPNFFISANGRTDPQAELEATLKAMLVSHDVDIDTHSDSGYINSIQKKQQISCQFPARTHWLSDQLGLTPATPDCDEFNAWMQKLDPQQLSVIFAEEYVDNPLSAFGHTLLLIDSTASLADPTAIDKAHALNDTVGGDPDDPFLVYAYKSVIGGYPNDITIDPYPEKLAYYVQQDKRDVWQYPLQLSNKEVQQIMRHVWETKDIEIPYYFTKDNCASEILRYIDIVRPEGSLLAQLKLAVVPSDVVRLLEKEGLITSEIYIPADDTLAQAKLNQPDKNLQLDTSSTGVDKTQNIGSALPKSSISANNKLIPTDLIPVNNNPLNAHAIQRTMLGAGEQDDTGYVSVSYRGVFNDLLDRPAGYPQNFHLEGIAFELRAFEDERNQHDNQVELENFTLVRGRSFNPINTAHKGDGGLSSWGASVQAKQIKDASQLNSDNHLVGSFAYEKGVSFAFGDPTAGSGQLPPHLCYALAQGAAQMGKGISHGYRVGVGANLGCRYQISNQARVVGEVTLPYWYHGDIGLQDTKDGYWQPQLSLAGQYDLNRTQAIRLQGNYQFQDRINDQDSLQLMYVRYF